MTNKSSLTKTVGELAGATLVSLALFGSPVLLISAALTQGNFERTRRDAAWIADADHNRIITSNEWASVYQALGKPYSNREGMDLNYNELNHYVDTHTH